MAAEQVFEWTHPDGMRRVILERVAEDRFRYLVFELVQDEDYGSRYEYWRSEYPPSGLYASALDARNDAANPAEAIRAARTNHAVIGPEVCVFGVQADLLSALIPLAFGAPDRCWNVYGPL